MDKLQWCRENAPEALKKYSDEEILEHMEPLWRKFAPKDSIAVDECYETVIKELRHTHGLQFIVGGDVALQFWSGGNPAQAHNMLIVCPNEGFTSGFMADTKRVLQSFNDREGFKFVTNTNVRTDKDVIEFNLGEERRFISFRTLPDPTIGTVQKCWGAEVLVTDVSYTVAWCLYMSSRYNKYLSEEITERLTNILRNHTIDMHIMYKRLAQFGDVDKIVIGVRFALVRAHVGDAGLETFLQCLKNGGYGFRTAAECFKKGVAE